MALVVDQAVRCDQLALVHRHPGLALGDHAGGEVQDHRVAAGQRHAGAERVGAKARIGATVRGDDAARDHVDEMHRHHAGGGGLLGPGADAAEVVRVAQRDDAAARRACTLNAQRHRLGTDDLAETAVAVQPQHRAAVEQRRDMGVGRQAALQKRIGVARQHANAVRVVAGEVGGDQVGRDGLHLGLLAAKTPHQALHRSAQARNGNQVGVGHRGFAVSLDGCHPSRPGSAGARRRANFASNTGMDALHNIDRRLTDLEVKACFTEDLVDTLNRLVASQQAQIDLLLREIGQLRQQQPDSDAGAFRSLRDELPPHY